MRRYRCAGKPKPRLLAGRLAAVGARRRHIAVRETPHYGRAASRADAGPLGPFGASPSGKAADFDSAIRRFESSRHSQPYNLSLSMAYCDSNFGDVAVVTVRFGICRMRETATNGAIRRISWPGLRRTLLNLRLCRARESETRFDNRNDRLASSDSPFTMCAWLLLEQRLCAQ
jgi:hypothetical protein